MPPKAHTKSQRHKQAEDSRNKAFLQAKSDRHNQSETYRDAAEHNAVPHSSLWHREHGRNDRISAHEHQQKLNHVEEAELIKLLRNLDGWGTHVTKSFVMDRANAVIRERDGNDNADTVTDSWLKRFRTRHPELKLMLSERKDAARGAAENDPVKFDLFFNNVRVLHSFCTDKSKLNL
ncbi:hypothetical protein CYLTODRAFT_144782 [Cylindrobasidium torrendii FP15055 ss-10]|uniref:HTH CENPB-type domain-containing protein n=1 Tax=Cylindrobasidium torrendii FP15055 ss-10 TaxID=1314674 RepID=A0A0D7BKQ3_9AGAR|nr:hypothetical protein CYLTODRAFT_144782 [Cylindrobasidium torrendii FP15055 ss-10]